MTEPKEQVAGQAVLGRQSAYATPWLTERHGYDPTYNETLVGTEESKEHSKALATSSKTKAPAKK